MASSSQASSLQELYPSEEDLIYEEEILRNPFNLKVWWRYVQARGDAPFRKRAVLYERALKAMPGSYKLWHAYLKERLDGVRDLPVSHSQHDALNNTFERALVTMHKMPRIWILYLNSLTEQRLLTRGRHAFDRALRSLPVTQHDRIWEPYLKLVSQKGVPIETALRVYRRYLKFDPTHIEDFIEFLFSAERWQETSERLAQVLNDESFYSVKGKTKHQLWLELCDLLTRHANEVTGLRVDAIIRGGIRKFTEEVGRLWTSLADYYIRRSLFEKARDVYEEGMTTVIRVRDFSMIFDAYTQFEESMLSAKMETLDEEEEDEEEDEEPMMRPSEREKTSPMREKMAKIDKTNDDLTNKVKPEMLPPPKKEKKSVKIDKISDDLTNKAKPKMGSSEREKSVKINQTIDDDVANQGNSEMPPSEIGRSAKIDQTIGDGALNGVNSEMGSPESEKSGKIDKTSEDLTNDAKPEMGSPEREKLVKINETNDNSMNNANSKKGSSEGEKSMKIGTTNDDSTNDTNSEKGSLEPEKLATIDKTKDDLMNGANSETGSPKRGKSVQIVKTSNDAANGTPDIAKCNQKPTIPLFWGNTKHGIDLKMLSKFWLNERRDIDLRLARLEKLMERRPELVSSVLLRQNPHNVHEWHKRVKLFDDPARQIHTYTEAVRTVDPFKAVGKPHTLWVAFARLYEKHGDLVNTRVVFEKAVQVNYKMVDDLAAVWCEWAEMELRHKNFKGARGLLKRATSEPSVAIKKRLAAEGDEPVQMKLYRSLKVWSFYVDLEESLGTLDSTRAVYERILELRIATPQIIINYALLLEENKYFEDAFKVYEKGVQVFKYPHVRDIWITYLTKFVKRYGGKKLERARDLFEQAIEKAPAEDAKPLYLQYAKLEEEFGLARHAMAVYDRAAKAVVESERMGIYEIYIARAAECFGVPKTRDIYEQAIESGLPEKDAKVMCMKYADMERNLGEIDRARALFKYASQFADPRSDMDFWEKWNEFEVQHGNEDTFREMLRIKRSVSASYSQTHFILPENLMQKEQGGRILLEDAVDTLKRAGLPDDEMAVLERQLAPVSVPPPKPPLLSAGASRDGMRAVGFVRGGVEGLEGQSGGASAAVANPEEIELGDEDSDDEEEVKVEVSQKKVPEAVFGDLAETARKLAADEEETDAKHARDSDEPMGALERFKRQRRQ